MEEKNRSPKPGFGERMDAITMNLELTVRATETLRETMHAMATTILEHDSQIGKLIALAQSQHDRITRLEGLKG